MTPRLIIDELLKGGLSIQIQEDKLSLVGPKENVTPAVIELVRNHKDVLLAYLSGFQDKGATDVGAKSNKFRGGRELRELNFSLFYFGNSEEESARTGGTYDLLLKGACYADTHGYSAVWVPERHFDPFGGLYPSPATLAAALAVITKNVGIRAGSVVLPLHHPARIAEDWAVIDNLSHGRVGIACASGWQPNDFVLKPENFPRRREIVFEYIDTIQRLWRGEHISLCDGGGTAKSIRIFPRPTQPELPIWITSAGKADTFSAAGKIGARVLTHLLGESLEQLEEKIRIYRNAYLAAGHKNGGDQVTLMLHTYIGVNEQAVLDKARKPFIDYLRSSLGLMKNLVSSLGLDVDVETVTADDLEGMLEYAYTRYISHSSLIGSRNNMMEMLYKLSSIGVDEVACLIDFGIDEISVLEGLEHLTSLKDIYKNEVSRQRSDVGIC